MKSLAIVCAVALVAFGCNKKEETPPEGQTTPTPAASAAPTVAVAATAPAAVDVDNMDIPTEEDFEEEAARDITAENMEAEYAKLEKEVNEP